MKLHASPGPEPFEFHDEPLGDLRDSTDGENLDDNYPAQEEVIEEKRTTRRILRTQTLQDNTHDPDATVRASLMAQRRTRTAAQRGDEWQDISSVPLSRLHADEKVKLDLGPNQTKRLFLGLGKRYKEVRKLTDVLRCIDVEVLDTSDVDSDTINAVKRLLAEIEDADQAQILIRLLTDAQGNPEILRQLVELAKSDPGAAKVAAASLNLARYDDAIDQLESLMHDNAPERSFQRILEEHPWMFGSEYSERLGRRDWIRDQQTDFMMRRTVDSYLEIIEIKTTLDGAPLFRYDQSHDSWYPQSELSRVLGQVVGYLDQIDAKRNDIYFDDGERVNKVRAKIVIGRDIDQAQIDALRRFNSHLHRIEIFTFDQLLSIAKRVRGHLVEVLDPVLVGADDDMGDIPF